MTQLGRQEAELPYAHTLSLCQPPPSPQGLKSNLEGCLWPVLHWRPSLAWPSLLRRARPLAHLPCLSLAPRASQRLVSSAPPPSPLPHAKSEGGAREGVPMKQSPS